MNDSDTIQLLRECDAGAKMAVSAIEEVLGGVREGEVRTLLEDSRAFHKRLGDQLHTLLERYGSEEKEPNPIAKGMSWMKTNFKMGMEQSDATAADLITDGCNMGVKSLHKYLNQYQAAEEKAKSLCRELAGEEERLCAALRPYL